MSKKPSKKIFINDDCIGCGGCYNLAPEYFGEVKDGRAHVIRQYDEKDKEGMDAVKNAAVNCPVNAIEIKEEE